MPWPRGAGWGPQDEGGRWVGTRTERPRARARWGWTRAGRARVRAGWGARQPAGAAWAEPAGANGLAPGGAVAAGRAGGSGAHPSLGPWNDAAPAPGRAGPQDELVRGCPRAAGRGDLGADQRSGGGAGRRPLRDLRGPRPQAPPRRVPRAVALRRPGARAGAGADRRAVPGLPYRPAHGVRQPARRWHAGPGAPGSHQRLESRADRRPHRRRVPPLGPAEPSAMDPRPGGAAPVPGRRRVRPRRPPGGDPADRPVLRSSGSVIRGSRGASGYGKDAATSTTSSTRSAGSAPASPQTPDQPPPTSEDDHPSTQTATE